MKRLDLVKKGILEWKEVPDPVIDANGQAIVEPVAVARCDLDLPIIQGKTLFRPPFPVGHEFVGRVLELSQDLQSEENSGLQPGALVAVSFQISCGHCNPCHKGLTKSCESVPPTAGFGMPPGASHFGGALSERILIPYAKQMCIPLPESLDPASVASLSDNIAEADKLIGRFLPRLKDQRILILGGMAASIGIYSALYAKQMSSNEILYMDDDPTNLERAQKLGIQCLEAAGFKKSPGRFDLVVDASANEKAWDTGLRSVAPGGLFSSASIFWTNRLQIPFMELYNNEVEMHLGRVNSLESMHRMLPSIVSGQFTPGEVVTRKADFSDAKEAWSEPGIKLVIEKKPA
ncbi:MAG TPA: alcohol dehydrogenase [Leptospiraceae bacterium]|nr:alcohol dehydrogenase [Spirochaetaceae bacterium]HBS04998.1 alcohol dehydrogenase [Leptospiraceae bacterium]|tara:strand:- start:63236 stop:64279 length:1044 start_codon:yes stop_codon:yes gene_type:complete